MKDRISRDELAQLHEVRVQAEQLMDQLDELEDRVGDIIGMSARERSELTDTTDHLTTFLYDRGTCEKLLEGLGIDVDPERA